MTVSAQDFCLHLLIQLRLSNLISVKEASGPAWAKPFKDQLETHPTDNQQTVIKDLDSENKKLSETINILENKVCS